MATVSELTNSRCPVTIAPDDSIVDALRKSRTENVSHLMVTEGRKLLGVCCVCDLQEADGGSSVRQCMNASPITVGVDVDILQVAMLMSTRHVSCLPVVACGELYGVITRHDLRCLGLLESETECCSFCGSTEHVRSIRDTSDVGVCLDCSRKSQPPDEFDELGGGG